MSDAYEVGVCARNNYLGRTVARQDRRSSAKTVLGPPGCEVTHAASGRRRAVSGLGSCKGSDLH
jgi:hypothetical protein